ncbi:MAG: transporter substrate-binding domain-containing protein [Gammaproteobacteria bacterium]|nr:transporter substrate-binding domain-containing protein [Gammaproteobacteria bacterium]MDH5802149.1 transporter substrate-binding domain-containing protein [Gammaproteobacteria bacterium]
MKHLLIINILFLLWFSPYLGAEPRVLIINSGSSAPMIKGDNEGFYPELVHALFKRLKREVRTVHLPSSSSLKNVTQGFDDGLIARIKGLEKKNKNLLLVPEKIMDLQFTAYTNNHNIKIESWEDLKPYNIAYIRGWKIYDKHVTAYKSLVKVKSPEQMFKLLKNQRVDVILYQSVPAKYLMKSLNYFPYEQRKYLASREMYMYMHKRHSNLIPLMSRELKKMKQDGTYKDLYQKNIIDEINPS